jgi:hypothetical protein
MSEEEKEMRKEKAMNAKNPEINTGGIENQEEEKPLKAKSASLKAGTIKVTI